MTTPRHLSSVLRLSPRTHRRLAPLAPLMAVPLMVTLVSCGWILPPIGADDGEEDTSDGSDGSGDNDGTDTSGREDGGLFTGPDLPPLPPQCDVFTQDCPSGEKCVFYASSGGTWDRYKCVPVLGDQAVGESCVYDGSEAATDDCDAESHCWDAIQTDEGELVGVCTPFCSGSGDQPACPEGFSCRVSGGGLAVCIDLCDPLEPDCPEGTSCYWTAAEFTCIPATQNIPPGGECGYVNDCQAPAVCTPAEVLPDCESESCCAPLCDVDSGEDPCGALLPGTVCTGFFKPGYELEGYEHVGVCTTPP